LFAARAAAALVSAVLRSPRAFLAADLVAAVVGVVELALVCLFFLVLLVVELFFLAAAAFSALIFFSIEATVALMVDKFFLAVEADLESALHADVFLSAEVWHDLPAF
jgi:hypothetical protein